MEIRLGTFAALAVALLLVAAPAAYPQGHFFDSNGVRIHYLDRGSGEPVVLVHGYLSPDMWAQIGLIDTLAAKYRVLVPDCRGHGQSDRPHDPASYGPQMGQDVVRLLDHAGIRHAHIVGYSMGARIVAHLLLTNPDRVVTATLGGGPPLGWSDEDDRLTEAGAKEMEAGVLTSLALRRGPPGAPKPTEEEIRKMSEAALAGQDRLALAAIARSYRSLAVTSDGLAKVRVPTLGVVGSADPLLDGVQRLEKAMPRFTLVVIDGGTHADAPRKPAFTTAILEFLAANSAKAAR